MVTHLSSLISVKSEGEVNTKIHLLCPESYTCDQQPDTLLLHLTALTSPLVLNVKL